MTILAVFPVGLLLLSVLVYLITTNKYWILFLFYPIFDMWIPFYRIQEVPLRVVFFAMTIALFFVKKSIGEKITLPHKPIRLVTLTVVLFLFLLFLMNSALTIFFDKGVNFAGLTVRTSMGILIALMIFHLFDSEKKIRIFINTLIILCLASSVVAIFQFVGSQWAYDIRSLILSNSEKFSSEEYQGILKRPSGLTSFSIQFSYHIALVTPLCYSLFIYTKRRLFKCILGISSLVFIFSAFGSLNRSATLGILFGLIYVAINMKSKKTSLLFITGFLLITVTSVIIMINTPDNYLFFHVLDRFSNFNAGFNSRTTLLIGYGILSFLYPFGTGNYTESLFIENKEYFTFLPNWEILLETAPHNQFIHVLVNTGYLGLLLLIIFFLQIVSNLHSVKKYSTSLYLKSVSIGLVGSFVSYIISSLFHNGGPFSGELAVWHFVGLYFVITGLCSRPQSLDKFRQNIMKQDIKS
jgi:hypothetical protein